ncbi:MAG: MFS transporter [Bacillota bacterium]
MGILKTDRAALNRSLWALCSVPFIMVLGNSMLIPVLPQIREALNLSLYRVGLLITAFSAPAAVSILFAGFLADRHGRKAVMVPALIIYGVGGLLAGAAAVLLRNSYPYIFAARIIQGIGAGGTYQIAMVLASDLFASEERARALGLLESWNGVGKVVSPVAGAGAALLSWYAPFFVYGVLALPVALTVHLGVSEAPAEEGSRTLRQYLGQLSEILRTKTVSFLVALFAGFTILLLLFGVLSYAADQMEVDLHIGTLGRGLIIAVPVGIMAITAYITGTVLQNQMGNLLRPAVAGGTGLFAAGLLSAILLTSPTASLVILALLGLATGLTLPALNTLITSSAPLKTRGLTTAFYGTVRFIGVALGPPAFGLLAAQSRLLLLATAGGTAAAAAILSAVLISPERMVPRDILED